MFFFIPSSPLSSLLCCEIEGENFVEPKLFAHSTYLSLARAVKKIFSFS